MLIKISEMPKKLRRSLRICFSKLKKLRIRSTSLPNPAPTTGSLLSACKFPKTPSFAAPDRSRRSRRSVIDVQPDAYAATLSDVDRFLFENFHSLYVRENITDDDDDNRHNSDSDSDSEPDPSPRAIKPSANRFFFPPPRTSKSLAAADDEAASSSSSRPNSEEAAEAVPKDSVAVTTFSKDPYDDFLRSMQGMVEAKHLGPGHGQLDWDFMEELLFCYLELNDRSVHKYILRAFTDLTVSLRRRRRRRRGRIPQGRDKVPGEAEMRRKAAEEE